MTKRAMARAERAKAVAMRVTGNKEGNGQGGKGNDDGNKGVGQGATTEMKRTVATASRVAHDEEGKCNSDKGSGQQGWQWQGQQGRW